MWFVKVFQFFMGLLNGIVVSVLAVCLVWTFQINFLYGIVFLITVGVLKKLWIT